LSVIVFVVAFGEVDGAHSPAADLAHDAIRSEARPSFDVAFKPNQS